MSEVFRVADAKQPKTPVRTFGKGRWKVFVEAVRGAPTEEQVRGFVAFALVLVLLALVLIPPAGKDDLVAASKTLAIAVIAFYFGLHGATPHRKAATQVEPAGDPDRGGATGPSGSVRA